jgi:hypothetical protein
MGSRDNRKIYRKLEEVNPRFKRDAFLDAAVISWST